MKLGMVGLGRMGSGMTERLRGEGHEVMTYDPQVESTASSLDELALQLEPPRVVWMMIPAGEITENTTRELIGILDRDDVLVDGGNSNFHDSQRRNAEAAEHGIHFLDVGVSGGIWGLKEGFCLMAGGPDEAVARIQPVLETLAPADGWAHVGPSGAGHFVKMVHNGIEYGLMQAYAEGFEVLNASEFELDLEQIAGIWRYGSVVRSWLLELLHDALDQHGSDTRGHRGLRRRFRRGPLDDLRGDQRGRAGAGHLRRALCPFRLAPGRVVRREDRCRAPPAVRRPRRQVEAMTADMSGARHPTCPRWPCLLTGNGRELAVDEVLAMSIRDTPGARHGTGLE